MMQCKDEEGMISVINLMFSYKLITILLLYIYMVREHTRWLDSITNSMDLSVSKHWEVVEDRGWWATQFMGSQSWSGLSN